MLYPKIGIRPTIDGRWGGVRESLEEQTMAMARNAKALIEENLRYPDGTPVQCVHRGLHHRRRCGGRCLRRQVHHRERGGHPDRYPLLVLRQRDL